MRKTAGGMTVSLPSAVLGSAETQALACFASSRKRRWVSWWEALDMRTAREAWSMRLWLEAGNQRQLKVAVAALSCQRAQSSF